MSGAPERDPAAARFAVLQMVRLSGAVLALFGVLIISGKVAWLPKLPEAAGYVLVAAGLVDFFVAPMLIARRWKSKP
jgi:uncharacterized protein YjeT (DUF2065 family)